MQSHQETYLGHGYREGEDAALGDIVLAEQSLRFVGEGNEVEFPYRGLVVEVRELEGEDIIFFTHAGYPEWRVYTLDEGILNHYVFQKFNHLREQAAEIRQIKHGMPRHVKATLLILAGLALLGVLLSTQSMRIVSMVVSQIPLQWEKDLGEKVFAKVKTEEKFSADAKARQTLEAIGQKVLSGSSGSMKPQFQFHIVEDEEVNAFALPGGYIIVHTGLLKAVERPEELAGVLAHELAHVLNRHSFRQIATDAGPMLLAQALFGTRNNLLGVITASSHLIGRQKFSREFEREADRAGWEYLVKAGIDPSGMIEFMKRLHSIEAGRFQAPAFLSSHPPTPERIQFLEAKWSELPNKKFRKMELAWPPLGQRQPPSP